MEKGQELWEVFWQPAPDNVYREKSISYRPVQSDVETPAPESKLSSEPQGAPAAQYVKHWHAGS